MDPRFIRALTPHLKFLGGQHITPDSSLADLGLDSMNAIDLLFDLEDTFGVTLRDEELNDTTFATAGHLWQAVLRAGSTGEIPGQAARP